MDTKDYNKDELVKNLASVMMHITDPAFEKASKMAVIACWALKFVIAVAGCLLLRHVNESFADLFMLVILAYSIYGHEMFINMKVKEDIVRKVIADNAMNGDNDGEEKEKDLEREESSQD